MTNMVVTYTKTQRNALSAEARGKKVENLYYEDSDIESGPYWVMEFEDGSEISFRFMSELVR